MYSLVKAGVGRLSCRQNWLARAIFALLPIIGVVGVTLRLYWNLARATDLAFAGETLYLSAGTNLLYQSILPPLPYSPLYAGWYAVLLAVFRNPILAYYVQLYLLAFLTAILVYVYLRQILVPRSLAFLATTLWIAQPACISVPWGTGQPHPYQFALLVFLGGAVLLHALKLENRISMAIAGVSCLLLAAAARPEYGLALLFFVVLEVASFASRPRQLERIRHAAYVRPAYLLIGAAVLMSALYLKGRAWVDATLAGTKPSFAAFGQHFSSYQVGASHQGGKLADWSMMVGRAYARAHSVLGAAVANPKVFLRFELHNLITAPRIVCAYLTTPPYVLLKASVLGLMVIWLLFISSSTVSARRRALRATASAMGFYVIAGAATAIPGTLITPTIHYFLPLFFVLLVGAVKWVSLILESEPAKFRSAAATAAVLLALSFAAVLSPFDHGKAGRKPLMAETAQIGAILKGQNLEGARILQSGWGGAYAAYLPYGLCEAVDPGDRHDGEGFWAFVGRARVNAILNDESLRSYRPFRSDPEFDSFLRSPNEFGWTALPVGTHGDVFYLPDRAQCALRR